MNKIKGIMNLPPKVAIKKSAIDIEGAELAAERIHTPPPVVVEKVRKKTLPPRPRRASPPLSAATEKVEKPRPARSAAQPVEAADLSGEATTRITLDLPASVYKAAKIKSFTEMMTLRAYITELLRADLNI